MPVAAPVWQMLTSMATVNPHLHQLLPRRVRLPIVLSWSWPTRSECIGRSPLWTKRTGLPQWFGATSQGIMRVSINIKFVRLDRSSCFVGIRHGRFFTVGRAIEQLRYGSGTSPVREFSPGGKRLASKTYPIPLRMIAPMTFWKNNTGH